MAGNAFLTVSIRTGEAPDNLSAHDLLAVATPPSGVVHEAM